jgi:hypothetical protein
MRNNSNATSNNVRMRRIRDSRKSAFTVRRVYLLLMNIGIQATANSATNHPAKSATTNNVRLAVGGERNE